MRSILCFNSKPCPFRGEMRGQDDLSKLTSPSPPTYYLCNAKTLEQMQPCILSEDTDLKLYGVKILVKDDQERKTRAWDPKRVVILRTDREETIYGPDFVDDKIEV